MASVCDKWIRVPRFWKFRKLSEHCFNGFYLRPQTFFFYEISHLISNEKKFLVNAVIFFIFLRFCLKFGKQCRHLHFWVLKLSPNVKAIIIMNWIFKTTWISSNYEKKSFWNRFTILERKSLKNMVNDFFFLRLKILISWV